MNQKKFAAELAMTAVLHTSTRKLDYHPHVHIVVPGGGVHRKSKQWVVQCRHVGRGMPALKYLSRYLYRGVISNKNIVKNDGTFVTFEYKDSKTKRMKTRRLQGEDFIHLMLQHTLPRGFRRARKILKTSLYFFVRNKYKPEFRGFLP